MTSKKLLVGALISALSLTACSRGSDDGDNKENSQNAAKANKSVNAGVSHSSAPSQIKPPSDPAGLKVVYKENWASENNVLSKYAVECKAAPGSSLIRIHNAKTGNTRFSIEEPNADFASLVSSESGDETFLIGDEEFEQYAQDRGVKFFSTYEAAILEECQHGASKAPTGATSVRYTILEMSRCQAALAITSDIIVKSMEQANGNVPVEQAALMMQAMDAATRLSSHMKSSVGESTATSYFQDGMQYVYSYGHEKYIRDHFSRCIDIAKTFPQSEAFKGVNLR